MNIQLDIPPGAIAQLFNSAIEGGDSVTTFSRGGWCDGIDPAKGTEFFKHVTRPGNRWWYGDENDFAREDIQIEIVERQAAADFGNDTEIIHVIDAQKIAEGLAKMARIFPRQFAQIMLDDIDSPCADAFLQATLFGEEKYA